MKTKRRISELTKRELGLYLSLVETVSSTESAGTLNTKKEMAQQLEMRLGVSWVVPLDINLASPKILSLAGLSDEVVSALRACRPILSWADLANLSGLTEENRQQIKAVFNIKPIQLPIGKVLQVDPDSPAMIIIAEEVEYQAGLADIHYRMEDDAELGTPAGRRFPAYKEEDGIVRYLDPRFLTVQMRKPLDDPGVIQLFSTAGVILFRRFQTEGLALLRLESERHGPAALNLAVSTLAKSSLTVIVEPAWIATDTIEIEYTPDEKEAYDESEGFAAQQAEAEAILAWNLEMIDATALGPGHPGITLVALDTGVDPDHPALAGQILPQPPGESRNFTGSLDVMPTDSHGHGTAVAGILVGNGSNGILGVAPGCSFMAMKVPLWGTLSAYASRRDALLDLADRSESGMKIIVNLSWRTNGDVLIIRDAVNQLVKAGSLVVCSAGNGSPVMHQPHYPSDYESTISVASLTVNMERAVYSYFGNEVDLAAPGGDEVNPIFCASLGGGIVEQYGTSFAAPHVAGALALAWSQLQTMDAANIRVLVESSARSLPETGLGHGLVSISEVRDRLESFLPDPVPVSDDDHCPENTVFPLSGVQLSELPCAMKAISLRILRNRAEIHSWEEVGMILGMTQTDVQCLRNHLDVEPEC